MTKHYLTDEARINAINEITRQIEVLGKTNSDALSYTDYRAIVNNLALLRNIIKAEVVNKALIGM